MKTFRLLAAAAATVAACVVLTSDPRGGFSGAAAQEKKLIRIATARGVNFVALWGVAPFADKHGLQIQMIDAVTNADQQRSIQVGGAELASLGYQSPAIMAEQGVAGIKVISGLYLGGQNLIMRKGVELRTWKDLEGKKIGRAPGTYAQVLFILAARANNVDVAKINLVNVTAVGTAELQALKNGDLDGLVLFSPTVDRGVVDGYAYYPQCCDISSTATFGGRNQILAASAEFLKDRETVVKFLKAYVEAKDFYLKNKDKATEVIGQFTGVSKDVVAEALKHSLLEHRVDIRTAIAVAKEGPSFGFTKADMSAKVADYFDLSYLSAATGTPVDQLDKLAR
jgi:sulfonate transport system substrate-binding protein